MPLPRERIGESCRTVLVPPAFRKPKYLREYCAVAKKRGDSTPFQLNTPIFCGVSRSTSTLGSIACDEMPRLPGCLVSLFRKLPWNVWFFATVHVTLPSKRLSSLVWAPGIPVSTRL